MVVHQHIGMNFNIKAVGHLPQGVEEENAILLFTDNVPFFITSGKDVILASLIFYPPLPCHIILNIITLFMSQVF